MIKSPRAKPTCFIKIFQSKTALLFKGSHFAFSGDRLRQEIMHLIMKGTQNIQQKRKQDTTVYVEAVAPRDILSLEP